MRKLLIPAVIVVLALATAPAFAAKGGQGKGSGGHGKPGATTDSSLSVVVVTDNDGDDLPDWGEQVTFDITTTATTEPNVSLTCTQNGVVVYGAITGYYDDYPWPWTQTMTLSSTMWSSGAANCTATLHYYQGNQTIDLATINFTAGP